MTDDKDFNEILNRCLNILKTKAVDYASDTDRLAEFRATAEAMDTSMEQVLGTYVNKHMRSIFTYCRGEELKGEPVEEKIMDVIVYMMLLFKMVQEKKEYTDSMDWPTDVELTEYYDNEERLRKKAAAVEALKEVKEEPLNVKEILVALKKGRDEVPTSTDTSSDYDYASFERDPL